ncbi:MAG: methionyl-tRNA formyltransferase, partial [Eggerthellaceae bacterium]|nr:methionyl-tRNA formyltransferase [Eggerthellaceae bacterium]
MRVVFMGTPRMAAVALEELSCRHDVVLAVTRPDAVSGRGKAKRPSAVKELAVGLGIPVLEASSIDDSALEALRAADPEAICVVAFGCLLPASVLELPRFGCLNVHASLLPRWRGAAPIERALLAGDKRVGYSIMKMDEGLDTGPYCVQGDMPVHDAPAGEIGDELAREGARALADVLDALAVGDVEWTIQDDDASTYAPKLGKSELGLDPKATAFENCLRVQASSDAHPARASIAGRDVTVERARVVDAEHLPEAVPNVQPGTALFVSKKLLLA